MNRRNFLQGIGTVLLAPSVLVLARELFPESGRRYADLKPADAVREHWRQYVPAGAKFPSPDGELKVSKAEWRQRLPADRFTILFENGTEPRYSSKLLDVDEPGLFVCAACELPLFTTPMKFHSGTGWPSFYTYIPETLETEWDFSLIWPRREYHCARCGGHQGHVFDGWPTPTGLRYCNNGLALRFLPADRSQA